MEVLIVVAVVWLVWAYVKYRNNTVHCSSCNWKGTQGRWDDNDGCPVCRSDINKK